MSDGNLYSWGHNPEGACGVREVMGVSTDEYIYTPTPVVNTFSGKKVLDFSLGENSMIIMCENNEVYFSGLGLAYKPVRWELPENKKIKLVSCGNNCLFAVSEDNVVYTNSR